MQDTTVLNGQYFSRDFFLIDWTLSFVFSPVIDLIGKCRDRCFCHYRLKAKNKEWDMSVCVWSIDVICFLYSASNLFLSHENYFTRYVFISKAIPFQRQLLISPSLLLKTSIDFKHYNMLSATPLLCNCFYWLYPHRNQGNNIWGKVYKWLYTH